MIPLRPQSFAVLHHLSANPDRVVSKDELMTSVWRGIAVTDDSLVPRGRWRGYDELRFRPPGEPTEGGYSLRVKMVNTRVTPERMAAQRKVLLADLDEVDYLGEYVSALKFTYRDGNNRLRYNDWQWFATPGTSIATLEMSVVGRVQDVPGLDALFAAFASTLRAGA